MIRRICVYCGARTGRRGGDVETARAMGREIAGRGLGLVFGGGHVGLMGALSDAALAAGGEVVGIIPEQLVTAELAHRGLTRLEVVQSMHERKARMAELADAFIALPGGFGTLDELFEILTWAQLGLHGKPCGLLDVDDFFAPLLAWMDGAVQAGFVPAHHRDMLRVDTDCARLLDRLEQAGPPSPGPWPDIARDG